MSTASASHNLLGAGLHRKTSTSSAGRGGQEHSPHRSSISTTRRGSEGDPINAALSNNYTSTGWARRVTNDTLVTNRQRSQLLRTVSHLTKDENRTVPAVNATEDDPTLPFTRFDLVPPPEYRARQQRKSLDVRRPRGQSVSEEGPFDVSNNNSQLSIALSPSLASQGKAKAAAAAAKLRRLSVSQLANRRFNDASSSPSSSPSTQQTPQDASTSIIANKEAKGQNVGGGGNTSVMDLNPSISNRSGLGSSRDRVESNCPFANSDLNQSTHLESSSDLGGERRSRLGGNRTALLT